MDKIIFRVYDTIDKQTHPPGPAGERFMIDQCGNLRTPQGLPCDNAYIIQLFSGVTDINGVNIYDGDVVSFYISGQQYMAKVVYDNNLLSWLLHALDGSADYEFVKFFDYTIVTNS